MLSSTFVLLIVAATVTRSDTVEDREQRRGLRRSDDLLHEDARSPYFRAGEFPAKLTMPLSAPTTPSHSYSQTQKELDSQQSPISTPVSQQVQAPPTSSLPSTFKMLWVLFLVYITAAAIFMTSRKAQTYLIYLHWIRPPKRWFPLTDLQSQRLSHTGRNITAGGLRGWHLVPPGPPFPPLFTSADAKDAYYEQRLSMPRQRVIIFFHGNCGTRAFPPKRVHIIKLLNAQLNAHIVTFDYSGFADSVGNNAPCERSFLDDACAVVRWVRARVHVTTSLYLYGQSLGTFAASHAAAHFSTAATATVTAATPTTSTDFSCDGTYDFHVDNGRANVGLVNTSPEGNEAQMITGVVLDAPPASIQTAAQTHPILLGFRLFGLTPLFRLVIRETLDSTRAVARARCPLLVMHGRKDSMIPPWQGKLLADTARAGGNRWVTYTEFSNVGHVDVSGADGYLLTLYDFIKQCESDSKQGPTMYK